MPSSLSQSLLDQYRTVRAFSEKICEPLVPEDYVVQSMPDVSPAKWHLAHTSWFYETFLLKPHLEDYTSINPQYDFLFNSYYNTIGERHCRVKRGVISRPTVDETYTYRAYVDRHMETLLCEADAAKLSELEPLLTLGLHHEQQHQELMVTDLKYNFFENPLCPVYRPRRDASASSVPEMEWIAFSEGVQEIGWDSAGFAFDNETPRHKEYIPAFALGSRLVTNGEYVKFIEDGGYENPEYWLSEGWGTVQKTSWSSPLCWWNQRGIWKEFTLAGMGPLDLTQPVCHVSLFEADAYARWAGARLATEAEWEVASETVPVCGNFADSGRFHPAPLDPNDAEPGRLHQMFGDVWEWTRSQYTPYPGYAPPPGALGEYNGKFMCNQFVLRGGSCATSHSHMRATYRNFFPPDARWQFTGIRLAKDV
jgi:ergothioneine biosynthesis protein EgtB